MTDTEYMRRAMQLAQMGKGYAAPNPMVGAVLVHNDRITGEGWHHAYGLAHAEVDCLNNVAEADRRLIPESTMYVTLEPCAHHGNTPPCATRLVQERVKEVVIANADPFEKVSGRGIEILKNGGITVRTGILEKEGRWVNRRFFCFHEQKRPYIILKWAQTTDGFIAPADRSRLQITGAESQQLVHKWRTQEAAIMVGVTTALNDNPYLTARLHEGRQPLRIVTDRTLSLPKNLNLFNNDAATWVVNEEREEVQANGISYIQLPFDTNFLPKLMARLHDARKISLIVEGGAALLNSFIDACLWDEARVFTGEMILNNGVAAPTLLNANEEWATTSDKDTLQLFTNKKSHYPYVADMEL